MFKIDDKAVAIDSPFTLRCGDDDIQFPADWLRNSSAAEREALGIIDVPDMLRPDDTFHAMQDNGGGSFTEATNAFVIMQKMMLEKGNESVRAALSPTDYYVTRLNDPSSAKEIPQRILDLRIGYRQRHAQAEAMIRACNMIDELAELQIDWSFAKAEELTVK